MFIEAIGCEPLQLRRVHLENSVSLDVYRQNGGYEAIKKVVDSMSPDDVINEVKKSALRGRGGTWPIGQPSAGIKAKHAAMFGDRSKMAVAKEALEALIAEYQRSEADERRLVTDTLSLRSRIERLRR